VDDVILKAYQQQPRRVQEPVPIHFDQEFRELDPATDTAPVVFLHGSDLFSDLPIVFGPPSYAAATTRHHTWWHVFADAFLSQPVIVIGASLREPDFEAYLALKKRPPQPLLPPSFYVARTIDDAVKAICNRLGLVPVQSTAAAFLNELATQVGDRQPPSILLARKVQLPSLLRAVREVPTLATLAGQFVFVNRRDGWPELGLSPETFYEGRDPQWEDIRRDLDVQLQVEGRLVDRIERHLGEGRPGSLGLSCLEGTVGSGKTTILMRVAAELGARGIDTLYFRGRERLRDDALTQLTNGLAAGERLLIVLDDIADHVNAVRRFISAYSESRGICHVLGAVRAGDRDRFDRNVRDLLEPHFEGVSEMSPLETLELARKLRGAAKLGRLAGETDATLAQRFAGTTGTEWGGQLLVVLLQVVPGGTFREDLKKEWATLPGGVSRKFYGVVCLASACGVGVRSAVVFRTLGGADASEVMREVFTGSMRGLTRWEDREYVRTRHRVVAEQTVQHCIEGAEIFEYALSLATALAPYVSRHTIMNRAPEARLARRLMDADGLVVPRLEARAEEWFGEIERHWNWNSRYWEQRALLTMRLGRYGRARDYAEQAIGIERHPLPMTTFALVNLVSIEKDKDLSRSSREELFQSAVDVLDQAIKRSLVMARMEVHPYHILLGRAANVAERLWPTGNEAFFEIVRRHALDAARRFAAAPEIRALLTELRRKGILAT
jgi:hypothetical protein